MLPAVHGLRQLELWHNFLATVAVLINVPKKIITSPGWRSIRA